MKLTNLERYTPKVLHNGDGIQYFRDETGLDWFKSISKFTKKYKLAIVETTGIICAIATEVSRLHPVGFSVVDVDTLPEGVDSDSLGNWVFDGEKVVVRTYTQAELQLEAENTRNKLLTDANNTISIWQSELLLGDISDEDKIKLKAWIAYIKALKSLEFPTPKNITWPQSPAN